MPRKYYPWAAHSMWEGCAQGGRPASCARSRGRISSAATPRTGEGRSLQFCYCIEYIARPPGIDNRRSGARQSHQRKQDKGTHQNTNGRGPAPMLLVKYNMARLEPLCDRSRRMMAVPNKID